MPHIRPPGLSESQRLAARPDGPDIPLTMQDHALRNAGLGKEKALKENRPYIPALSFHWLTPLYDPLLRWVMREQAFKGSLVRRADIRPGLRVLDLGCGTGTLTLLIKRLHPGAQVTGLDADPNVLAIARSKAARAQAALPLDEGRATSLPYGDCSFDRVLLSLVLHHLTLDDKRRAAREVFRVLRPGGEFHVVDFGKPFSAYTRLAAALLHGLEEAADNFDGLLPGILRSAGFAAVEEIDLYATLLGGLSHLRAVKGLPQSG